MVRRLPTEPLAVSALPSVSSRDEYEAARTRLLAREKAHTREGDAIAAERRRLPMIEIPASFTVVGAKGKVSFVDVFEGRRMLVACIPGTGSAGAPARARHDAGLPL
jgi:predicted dithiol-disulfide oxidoreductase (DUF899 family)